jgi:hypothetical protein
MLHKEQLQNNNNKYSSLIETLKHKAIDGGEECNGLPLEVEELPKVGFDGTFYKVKKTEEIKTVWAYIPGTLNNDLSYIGIVYTLEIVDDYPNNPSVSDSDVQLLHFYCIKSMNGLYFYEDNSWQSVPDKLGLPFVGIVSNLNEFTEAGIYVISGTNTTTTLYLFENDKYREVGDAGYKSIAYCFLNSTTPCYLTLPYEWETVPSGAFIDTIQIIGVTIHKYITSIENSSFMKCSSLFRVIFEEDSRLVSIGKNAFAGCGLLSITIPNSVTTIMYAAFYDCSNLKSIEIPNSVTSIEDYVFYKCTSLESIEIPEGVTDIDAYTFNSCTSLTTITLQSTTPPTLSKSALANCTALAEIRIPMSAVEAYKSATNWSEYADIIVGYE